MSWGRDAIEAYLTDPGRCIIKSDPQLFTSKAKRVSNMAANGKQKEYGVSLIQVQQWRLLFQSGSSSANWSSSTTESTAQSPGTDPQPLFPKIYFPNVFRRNGAWKRNNSFPLPVTAGTFSPIFPAPKWSTNSPFSVTTFRVSHSPLQELWGLGREEHRRACVL